jgi:hypothetical protein
MTHDYKRNGTTTPFAALSVSRPKNVSTRFNQLLEVGVQVPDGPNVHLILDHYPGPAGFHRQRRLGAIQRLDLGLFFHA